MSLIRLIKKRLKSILRFLFLDREIPHLYQKAAASPVEENKIVFIEVRFPEITDSFRLLYDELKKDSRYTVKEHYLLNFTAGLPEYRRRVLAMVKDVATAKYIFINDASTAVAAIPLRKETKLIQVWHACGAFKKFGLSTADLLFGDHSLLLAHLLIEPPAANDTGSKYTQCQDGTEETVNKGHSVSFQ